MKKPIFLKVFGGSVIIILAFGGVIALLSFATIRRHYESTLAQKTEYQGRALNVYVQPLVEAGRTEELDAFLKKIGKEIHSRVTVIDPQGQILADSEADPAEMESHRYRPEVAEALEGKVGKAIRDSATIKDKMLYVGIPITKNGRILGVLRMSLYMKDIDPLLRNLTKAVGRSVLLTALVALLLALLLSLHIIRPIRKLTGAARQVAAGRFDTRLTIRRRDEFRELGLAFNAMTSQVRQLFGEVSQQKEELSRVIASIHEGLVVIEKDGKVAIANDNFKDLIGEKKPEGKFHWETIRNPSIQAFIERAMASEGLFTEEMRIDDRRFLCTAGSAGAQGRFIITFHDLTAVRKGS